MKIKVKDFDETSAAELKAIQIRKLKALYQSFPIATKLWLSMKTDISIEFIKENWQSITS